MQAEPTDCECDFDDDEGELDPERHAQDAVLTILDTKALVLDTDEDG